MNSFPAHFSIRKLLPLLAGGVTALALAGCMGFGGQGGGGALPQGLTARMDVPGASLDAAQALGLVNAFRASRGVPPLANDGGLDGSAQALARQYASTNQPPRKPGELVDVRFSAGYQTFAETFSGWRNVTADANALANPAARRAGLAVVQDPSSSYGIYWVLVLDD